MQLVELGKTTVGKKPPAANPIGWVTMFALKEIVVAEIGCTNTWQFWQKA
jgi:hypothetical protein